MNVVLVEWIDSCGHDNWVSSSEIRALGKEPYTIQSVGWLVEKTQHATTLVPHRGEENAEGLYMGRGAVAIPNVAIVRIKTLMRPRPRPRPRTQTGGTQRP